MAIANFKSGYGMTNAQLLDWLIVRLRDETKGALSALEAFEISAKIADLGEPIARFTYYIQNRIGPLRVESDPEILARTTVKTREMLEDYIAHPEMYKF